MKQIKAFIHRARVGDIVHALEAAGHRQLTVFDVKGLLQAVSNRESQYSIALGEKVTSEVQLELVCPDDDVERAVQLIRTLGRTGQPVSGWVYVSPVDLALPIEGGDGKGPSSHS